MEALCCAQARTDGSFSIEIMVVQRLDRANAIVLPPAPAKRSIKTVFVEGVRAERSSDTLLVVC